jgi:hypothetical protein
VRFLPPLLSSFDFFWCFLCSLRFLERFLLRLAKFSIAFSRLRIAFLRRFPLD